RRAGAGRGEELVGTVLVELLLADARAEKTTYVKSVPGRARRERGSVIGRRRISGTAVKIGGLHTKWQRQRHCKCRSRQRSAHDIPPRPEPLPSRNRSALKLGLRNAVNGSAVAIGRKGCGNGHPSATFRHRAPDPRAR